MKARGEVWCPALSQSALPTAAFLLYLGLLERGSLPKVQHRLASGESSPQQSSGMAAQLAALRPSFTHSPRTEGQLPALPLSRGLGKGGHCAKQATGIRAVKGNQATLLLGVCPQDRASLAKPSSTQRGDKGEVCKRWGFMPHYSQAPPKSSLEPHSSPSPASTRGRRQNTPTLFPSH